MLSFLTFLTFSCHFSAAFLPLSSRFILVFVSLFVVVLVFVRVVHVVVVLVVIVLVSVLVLVLSIVFVLKNGRALLCFSAATASKISCRAQNSD